MHEVKMASGNYANFLKIDDQPQSLALCVGGLPIRPILTFTCSVAAVAELVIGQVGHPHMVPSLVRWMAYTAGVASLWGLMSACNTASDVGRTIVYVDKPRGIVFGPMLNEGVSLAECKSISCVRVWRSEGHHIAWIKQVEIDLTNRINGPTHYVLVASSDVANLARFYNRLKRLVPSEADGKDNDPPQAGDAPRWKC